MSDRIGTVRAVSFSPTGSTRRVLRSIAAGIGAARVQEDSLDRPAWREAGVQVGADELLLVGMPVYAGSGNERCRLRGQLWQPGV